MRKTLLLVCIALTMLISSVALAGKLAGVTLPDKANVGGTTLVLNGMGLREKFTFDVYVGGLYLTAKSKDGGKIVNDDAPKRMVMHFLRDVDKEKLIETLDEALKKQKIAKDKRAKLRGWMRDAKEGDQIIIDYVPGKGTTFIDKPAKGSQKPMGTIEGIEFMKAIFSIYVGKNPADEDLKKGLLGK